MNNSIFSVYSEVYSVAMMRDIKPVAYVPASAKTGNSRFGALVKLLRRG